MIATLNIRILCQTSGLIIGLFLILAALSSLSVAESSFRNHDYPDISKLDFVSDQTPVLILESIEREDYVSIRRKLRQNAWENAEAGSDELCESWLYWYLWVDLWEKPEIEWVEKWAKISEHGNEIAGRFPDLLEGRKKPLGDHLDQNLKRTLLKELQLSRTFFDLLDDSDHVPRVMRILQSLYLERPADFDRYLNLALAIALVHDVPPPVSWPHRQVAFKDFPRQLPDFRDTFDYFTSLQDDRKSINNLRILSVEQLILMVDFQPRIPLDNDTRILVQKWVPPKADEFDSIYNKVKYRFDRLRRGVYVWPGGSYDLPSILRQGGICVDQAFFSSQVGKALGMPTILFLGRGLDGRHAWFGYFDKSGHWNLDAGRYDRAAFITGFAQNPQTWRFYNDHEVNFLQQDVWKQPGYRPSRLYCHLADSFWRVKRYNEAYRAYRKSIAIYSRNLNAWNGLIGLVEAYGKTGKQQLNLNETLTLEQILEEGIHAFKAYPDIETPFITQLRSLLEAQGKVVNAEMLIRYLTASNRSLRSDIAVRIYAWELLRMRQFGAPLGDQLREYRVIMSMLGTKGGTEAYDKIVRPFLSYLLNINEDNIAKTVLNHAEKTLKTRSGSQLEAEIQSVKRFLQQQ